MLASRLGSLTTVLTWLRSRACAAPPTLSCNQGPWSTPPSTRPAPVGSLTTVLTWLRSRACAGMQGWALCACVQTMCSAPPNPLLQPRPLVYLPVPQASSGGYPPTPQGILQKTPFFFFLYVWARAYHLPPRNRSPWTPDRQANPSLTPSPGIKALGLPPRPPGQL